MAELFTRRSALKAGLGTVVLPLFSNPLSIAAQDKSSRLLHTFSSEDSGFTSALNKYFPGLLDESEAVALLPLFYLLTNESDLGVSALGLKWMFTGSTGKHSSFDRQAVKADPTCLLTGHRPLISSQGVRLISPFFSWSPAGFAHQPKPRDWSHVLSHNEQTRYRVKQMASTSHIAMSVDAVIYSDGKLVGPDRSGLAKYYTATRNAEHDEALSIKRNLIKGRDGAAIERMLTSKIVTDDTIPAPARSRRYTDARRRQAALFVNAHRTQSPRRFARIVSTIAKTPPTIITREN